MNIKSLCLLGLAGAICVSTGVASEQHPSLPSHEHNGNVANQTGQNTQPQNGTKYEPDLIAVPVAHGQEVEQNPNLELYGSALRQLQAYDLFKEALPSSQNMLNANAQYELDPNQYEIEVPGQNTNNNQQGNQTNSEDQSHDKPQTGNSENSIDCMNEMKF